MILRDALERRPTIFIVRRTIMAKMTKKDVPAKDLDRRMAGELVPEPAAKRIR